jgi:RNA polymerase sigma-70 factor (ECF subfamily)
MCHPFDALRAGSEGASFATEGSPPGKCEILRTLEKRQGAHTVPVSFRENDMLAKEKATLRCNDRVLSDLSWWKREQSATFNYGKHLMSEKISPELAVEALKSGDRNEFARLVDAYSAPIYRMAMKMLSNQQDAEDVLQNTFLNAFKHIHDFEERSSLATWLYRIAANEALMMIRKQRPETTLTDTSLEDDEGEDYSPVQFVDWCCLPEDELLSSEARSRLDRAIQHLPEKLRIVFILRDLEGLSIEETSQALNLSQTAVKTRLLCARLNLREQLSSYYGERLRDRSKAI